MYVLLDSMNKTTKLCQHGHDVEEACFECNYPGQIEAYNKIMDECEY